MSPALMKQLDLAVKNVLVYFLYIKIIQIMKTHLPDHQQIYVPTRLRCNHEIAYTHNLRLETTMQLLGRHQAALAINDFAWTRITSSENHSSDGLTSEHLMSSAVTLTASNTYFLLLF